MIQVSELFSLQHISLGYYEQRSCHSICTGHLDVYHLFGRCTEVWQLTPVHLFGISESRSDVTENVISINDYTVLRSDNDYPLHTCAGLYALKFKENRVRCRLDLKTEITECIWGEITESKTKPLPLGMFIEILHHRRNGLTNLWTWWIEQQKTT